MDEVNKYGSIILHTNAIMQVYKSFGKQVRRVINLDQLQGASVDQITKPLYLILGLLIAVLGAAVYFMSGDYVTEEYGRIRLLLLILSLLVTVIFAYSYVVTRRTYVSFYSGDINITMVISGEEIDDAWNFIVEVIEYRNGMLKTVDLDLEYQEDDQE